jgi:hypothetical protein
MTEVRPQPLTHATLRRAATRTITALIPCGTTPADSRQGTRPGQIQGARDEMMRLTALNVWRCAAASPLLCRF